ncbi:glycosyltransferase [Colwellia sp. TT2012]|uniref:glycosyltransferase n=1 Tax=Colwellia sp. TT2012 TaxID=1720342 RepID=UPI000710DA51|nr:glycosyltransferase [Colwellia sp. TT2012]
MEEQTNRTILMVALEFPPCQSAGVQRTLKFAEYLAELGWQVIVLTVDESVYVVKDQQISIPENIKVYRCHAYDSAIDFSVKGKYFAWSKVPDRWWTWAIKAIPLGKKLIEKYQPDIIWSTYPVSTAHFIAYKLQQFSKRPWIADYRDPLQCRYDNKVLKYSYIAKWIEKKTILHCSKAVFTTERAAQLYRRLYPDEQLTKFNVIENGFDEANFNDLPKLPDIENSRFTLLHSGAVYSQGRDPKALFEAIHLLKNEGIVDSSNFTLIFRGAASNHVIKSQILQLKIEDLIECKPSIPYKESLAEMKSASVLVLIQGELFNNQIPGKAYEYIRANRPILALTPKTSATGELYRNYALSRTEDNADLIKQAIKIFIENRDEYVDKPDVNMYSRQQKALELGTLLNELCLNSVKIIN